MPEASTQRQFHDSPLMLKQQSAGAVRRSHGVARVCARYAKVAPRVWRVWEKPPPKELKCTWDDPCGRCQGCRDRVDTYIKREEVKKVAGAAAAAVIAAVFVDAQRGPSGDNGPGQDGAKKAARTAAVAASITAVCAVCVDAAAPQQGAIAGVLAVVCGALLELGADAGSETAAAAATELEGFDEAEVSEDEEVTGTTSPTTPGAHPVRPFCSSLGLLAAAAPVRVPPESAVAPPAAQPPPQPCPPPAAAELGLSPVQVSIRVRDFLWHERPPVDCGETPAPAAVFAVGPRAVGVQGGGGVPDLVCQADQALWSVRGGTNEYQGQAEVFEAVGTPLARAVFEGQDALLVACGPSGSGKTYSVFGLPGEEGILPRLLGLLFNSGAAASLELEVLAVYQGNTYCLLTEAAHRAQKRREIKPAAKQWGSLRPAEREAALQRLKAGRRAARQLRRAKREAGAPARMRASAVRLLGPDQQHGTAEAVGSLRLVVEDPAAAVAAIVAAAKCRPQAATPVNAQSSRAHMVVNLTVRRKDGGSSRLQVADLAGGEKLRVHCQEPRRLEGQVINSSLFAVKRAVAALSRGDKHVPTRDNVLTRVLALGSCHVEWLTTVSPAAVSAGQSRTALQEAEVAKGVAKVRTDAIVAQREAERFARAVAERSRLQLRAVAACAAAGYAEDRILAARREAAERVTPSLVKAAVALCCGVHNQLWEAAVRRVKEAQRAGGDRWREWYVSQLPKGKRKTLDPAAHALPVLLGVLNATPPPAVRPAPEQPPPSLSQDGSDPEDEKQRIRERKAAKARRAREKQRQARLEEAEEVRAAAEEAREQNAEAEAAKEATEAEEVERSEWQKKGKKRQRRRGGKATEHT